MRKCLLERLNLLPRMFLETLKRVSLLELWFVAGCPDNYLTDGQVSVWIIRVNNITCRGRIIRSLNYFVVGI